MMIISNKNIIYLHLFRDWRMEGELTVGDGVARRPAPVLRPVVQVVAVAVAGAAVGRLHPRRLLRCPAAASPAVVPAVLR